MLNAESIIGRCESVVFDCADTLLRLDPPREVIFRDAAAEAGLDLQLRDIAHAYELVDFAQKIKSSELKSDTAKFDFYRSYNASLCAALGIRQSLERLNPILIQRFSQRRRWVAFDDAADAMRAIGERVPVHILANWDNGLEDVVRQAGLRELAHDVAASAALGAEKPQRACFDAFLSRNALPADRVIYVGNEYIADVIGAREAGMTPILVDRDDRLPAADSLRVRSLGELIPLFARRSVSDQQCSTLA
jgi:putative hydrolase of the HAD superfamily